MKHYLFAALALVLTGIACDNSGSSDATGTTVPSVPLTTETFKGTVQVMGSDFKNFTVAQTGEVDVTLTAAGPPPTITMGLGVGAGGSACTLLTGATVNTPAGTTAQLSGTASAGAYCVEVYDIGNQAGPVDYTVTVAHP